MSDDIENLIAAFEAGMAGKPNYARGLAALAEIVAGKGDRPRAFTLARAAIAAAGSDVVAAARAQRLLRGLIPRYHVTMMNDPWRNLAWDKALRRAIRPGMQVLEIGTGAGMLAMIAARAGAAKVTTCEFNPVAANLARELVARNGYGERIEVLTKRSQKLGVGTDLARPADLLFCDIFADNLFDFDPLAAIADAKARLLARDAPVVPAAAGLRIALANWSHYDRICHIGSAGGFDLSPMADFTPVVLNLAVADPDLTLLSAAHPTFRFDFSASTFALDGACEISCVAEQDGEANGVVQWIRLELDGETQLEARPEPGAVFFSQLQFYPFREPQRLRAGDTLRVLSAYHGTRLETCLAKT